MQLQYKWTQTKQLYTNTHEIETTQITKKQLKLTFFYFADLGSGCNRNFALDTENKVNLNLAAYPKEYPEILSYYLKVFSLTLLLLSEWTFAFVSVSEYNVFDKSL